MPQLIKKAPAALRALKIAMAQKQELPHISELVEEFIRCIGGQKAFAKRLAAEFEKAKEGSQTRQRILDLVMHAWKYADQTKPKREDMGLLTDEDLDAVLQDLMGKTDGEDAG